MENHETTMQSGTEPELPAYLRKQAEQPKPLAARPFGLPGVAGGMPVGLPMGLLGGVMALLLVLVVGLGLASAHAGANGSDQGAAGPVATAAPTATQASGLASIATATAWPTPTALPTPTATATAVPTATPKPVPPPPPPPTATPAPSCNYGGAPPNPWCYTFTDTGKLIYRPPSSFCTYFNCIKSFWQHTNGYVDECRDGTYSHSGGVQGACSYHGGELRPLYAP